VGRVDEGDDAVEQVTLAQFFVDEKGLCHRGRVGQTGAFDDQPIESDFAAVQPFEQQIQGLGQVGVNGAADAAVGQGHDLHRLVAQQLGIDTGVAEFVFDHGDFQAVLGFQQMAQQGGLAGAEETAEHRDRDGRGQTLSPSQDNRTIQKQMWEPACWR